MMWSSENWYLQRSCHIHVNVSIWSAAVDGSHWIQAFDRSKREPLVPPVQDLRLMASFFLEHYVQRLLQKSRLNVKDFFNGSIVILCINLLMMSKKIKLISNGNVVDSKWFGLWQNLQSILKFISPPKIIELDRTKFREKIVIHSILKKSRTKLNDKTTITELEI
jgi:hypothetical protein